MIELRLDSVVFSNPFCEVSAYSFYRKLHHDLEDIQTLPSPPQFEYAAQRKLFFSNSDSINTIERFDFLTI